MADVESRAGNNTTRGKSASVRRQPTWRSHLLESIHDGREPDLLLELELLTLSLATGIQDATTFPDYKCFASNQTGNTVLFAVGASGLSKGAFSLENVAVSLGVFVGGCVVMGQLGNAVGAKRRAWVMATNVFSTALIAAAAAVQYLHPIHETGPAALAVICLLAFGSGAQVAMARPLNVPQITTAMATAAYVDLLVDPKLGSLKNHERNRRLLFISMLAVGSFIGAFAAAGVSSAFALLLSAILKAVVCVLFYFNHAE